MRDEECAFSAIGFTIIIILIAFVIILINDSHDNNKRSELISSMKSELISSMKLELMNFLNQMESCATDNEGYRYEILDCKEELIKNREMARMHLF